MARTCDRCGREINAGNRAEFINSITNSAESEFNGVYDFCLLCASILLAPLEGRSVEHEQHVGEQG